jgi:hypothetical protein
VLLEACCLHSACAEQYRADPGMLPCWRRSVPRRPLMYLGGVGAHAQLSRRLTARSARNGGEPAFRDKLEGIRGGV